MKNNKGKGLHSALNPIKTHRKVSKKEFFCGDGTVLYLGCGGHYMNQHMR